MEAQVLKLIIDYGLETVVIALAINVLTGITKLPVKALAKKMEDGTKITKYLVFMPVVYGFVLSVIYLKIRTGTVVFNKAFAALWLSSSSLSLTLYAVFEKLFPSKEKILKDYEIEANKKLITELQALANSKSAVDGSVNRVEKAEEIGDTVMKTSESQEKIPLTPAEPLETESTEGKQPVKIVLRGKANVKTEPESQSV